MEDRWVSKAYVPSPDLSQTNLTPTTFIDDFTENSVRLPK